MRKATLIVAALFMMVSASALADNVSDHVPVQRVVSPGGIEAWLVQENTVPVIAINFSVEAGARFDPADRHGLAAFTAGMLDEGAGDLDSQAFKAALEDKAIRMDFGADDDTISGSLSVLPVYVKDATRLLALALSKPRFDKTAIERVRGQILVSLAEDESNPDSIASKAWFATALKGHPYSYPAYGTPESIKRITRSDIAKFFAHSIGRERIKIAAVGPIDAKSLGEMIDAVFGGLPQLGSAPAAPEIAIVSQSAPLIISRDIPQSVVQFGAASVRPNVADAMPTYVMNYIYGGGSFASRLMDEIREKRGLTYGISTGVYYFQGGGLILGSFSTRNETAGEAYRLLVSETERIARGGVTDKEFADAKTY